MSVPRREEKIPGEPREEEPSCPIRAPGNEPYPQEHYSKESCGYTNLNWVHWHAVDDRASKSEREVQHQEGCRSFGVRGAGSPMVIWIHNFRVHMLLLLNSMFGPKFPDQWAVPLVPMLSCANSDGAAVPCQQDNFSRKRRALGL